MQFVYLNGRLQPEAEAMVSVHDRGFQYGDGLFETLVIWSGRPFRWQEHFSRLQQGLQALRIPLPFREAELQRQAAELVETSQSPQAVLRLAISRGIGPRGYSPRGANQPTVVLSLHPLPAVTPGKPVQWKLRTSSFTIPIHNEVSGFKTANKLLHVLARQEAEMGGADEALLLNAKRCIASAASGNILWISDGVLGFAPDHCGALPGITQQVLIEIAHRRGMDVAACEITPANLADAQGALITLSTLGVVEIISLDEKPMARSPLASKLHAAYWAQVADECDNAGRPKKGFAQRRKDG